MANPEENNNQKLERHRNQAHRSETLFQTSLLVSFYNKLEYLKLVLASLEMQTMKDFEIIICDDGSRPEIKQELHRWMDHLNLNIQHIWHPDRGWTKNEILNWGIHYSQSDYLIFIDGDCVLHPEFIHEHFENREKKVALSGRRLDLSPGITSMLDTQKIKEGFLQKNLWWIIPRISWRKDNNGVKAIYLKPGWLRSLLNRKSRGLVGCNFSVHKWDMLAINGFDTRYAGPGTGEDSDVQYRLELDGVTIQPFTHAAIQYHLYHPLLPRPNENEKLFSEIKKGGHAVTPFGISELIKKS